MDGKHLQTPRTPLLGYVLLGAVLLVALYFVSQTPTPSPLSNTTDFPVEKQKIQLPSHFEFEVVTSDEDRARGLSGRVVPDHYGMLFVFTEPMRYGFWMKDMLVSIDMVWLSEDGTILGIEHEVSPLTYPQTFRSPTPAVYVLETRAGYAREQGWDEGEVIPLPQ